MKLVLGKAILSGAILALPIGGSTALGFVFRAQANDVRGRMALEELRGPAAPEGAFVEVVIDARILAIDELPVEDGMAAIAAGTTVLTIAGAPELLATCDTPGCGATEQGLQVAFGQVCGTSTVMACALSPEMIAFVDAEAGRRGLPQDAMHVLLLGETPDGARASMIAMFSLAVFLVLGWAGLVALTSRRHEGPPRVVEERALAAARAGADIRPALLALAPFGYRVEVDVPGRMVLVRGPTEMQARVWGITSSERVPCRAIVEWTDTPYRGTELRLRVEDAVSWMRTLPGPFADLVRAAVAGTASQISTALDARAA